MKLPIYLDNNSTTPMDERVFEAMKPYFLEVFGNAASRNHSFGWEAEEAVEKARKQVADLIGASEKEIIFTSGATESNNIAIKGAAEIYEQKGNHIITCSIEHKAVIDPCKKLEKHGFEVTFLNPDKYGMVSAEQVEKAITDKTILVSLMMGNNEIGTINPVKEIGAVCRKRNVVFHTDATQCVGKIPVDVDGMNIDVMSVSGHKIYGPKGIGALYVRRKNPRVKLAGVIDGGGHERGMRSGTLNVPGIVGLGKACEIAGKEMEQETKRINYLRDKLKNKIFSSIDEVYLNGHPTQRLPGNLNISFAYVEGEGLMMAMKDLAVSSGSACTSASLEPSYVLKGLGIGDELAHSSIRFGIGRFNTEEEIDFAGEQIINAVNHLREMSPLYEMVKDGIDLKSVVWTDHH
ncbi:IscS subfamily cysteine desulfurase [bacterium]|nr:IscS subfamily cysteine desulfurase [bacterium]